MVKDRIKGFHILFFIFIALFLLSPQMTSALLKAEDKAAQSENPPVVPKAFKDVHSLILKLLEKRKVPSITIAVAKDGEILWEQGYGWANREKKIKTTPDTEYHLASISKAMTATGLMVLVERGLVDLDRPANEYLGEAKLVARMGNADDATVRRLLFHRYRPVLQELVFFL